MDLTNVMWPICTKFMIKFNKIKKSIPHYSREDCRLVFVSSLHLLRMMTKMEPTAVVCSWISIVSMVLGGNLKQSIRVLRVEV